MPGSLSETFCSACSHIPGNFHHCERLDCQFSPSSSAHNFSPAHREDRLSYQSSVTTVSGLSPASARRSTSFSQGLE